MNLQPQIQLKSKLIPLLVSLVFIMQLVDPSPVWTILLVGLGGSWLIGYLWVGGLKTNLSLRREMRFGWAQVGDRLEERFTIVNGSPLPALWVEVDDHSDLPGYEISQVTAVGGNTKNQWRTQGVCSQRGVFTLGPTTLQTGDPFGIYRLTLASLASASLVVMPPVIPLPNIEIASGGRRGEGRPRANAPERTMSTASVRQYTPGDRFQLIHWRTSARQDDLYVRLLEGAPAGDWWIFLDLDRRVQVGQGGDSTEEFGIILAASLADHGLRSGQPVGLAASSEKLVWLSPREGEGQRWSILRALASADPGSHLLSELLARNQTGIGQRSSLVIITPNIRGDWVEALFPLMWRGVVPTILLLDPQTFDPGLERTTQLEGLLETLAGMGVRRYVFTRELLDRPEARPGVQGRWEFRISPRGRAIAVEHPAETAWKDLT